ncbi:uncharacterized protein LOC119667324 [Teleopsis dalmanni]|uniref:uncharacterized protein LOC119661886 n=1 Tax=Teleopsis dalmanni TaxID=139649 RepID=UPI0018CE745F|nr:uncharacterized protein LOC119661886 [Teleopsis dalmanni]XP_037932542.1 uncharacterized protein LOC119667324 [Teleopsis dalmanni]
MEDVNVEDSGKILTRAAKKEFGKQQQEKITRIEKESNSEAEEQIEIETKTAEGVSNINKKNVESDINSSSNNKSSDTITMANTELTDLIRLLTVKFTNEMSNSSTNGEDMIPCFDGEAGMSVEKWSENLEDMADAYKWSDTQKLVFARNKITKVAKLFVQTLTTKNYSTFKTEMLTEFTHTYSSIEVHNQLRERKKKDSESAHEYILHMRNIGATGSVEQKSVIQYIVDGIKGRPENKMTLYAAKNYLELEEQIEIYERISKMKPMNEKYGKNKEVKKEHCYNCGSKEHKRRECTEKQKCFKCNKSGHIAKNCLETNLGAKSCLIDGGADITLVKQSLFKSNFVQKQVENYTEEIVGFGGAKTNPEGKILCEIELDKIKLEHHLVIVPDYAVNYYVVIGYDVLSKCRYTSDENGYSFTLLISKIKHEEKEIMNITISKDEVKYEKEIEELKNNYKPMKWSKSPVEMKIILAKKEPIYASPSRKASEEAKIITTQVEEWLKGGIIRKSTSQYCSRVVLAAKKDGTIRVYVD